MTSIEGKVVLVTGGNRGIGYGVAKSLLEAGAKVAITSRTVSNAEEAARQLNSSEILALQMDVRNLPEQEAAVAAVVKKWGKLDVLIANAGLGHFAPIQSMTKVQWLETIDTNLTGVFYSVKASIDALKKSKGYIITVASLAGTNFFANGSAYNASKFGLVGFTQAIMLDLRADGIKVTTIMPGSVATEFNGNEPRPEDAWKIQPEDLGQVVVDLLRMHPRTLPSKVEIRPSIPK